MPSLSMKPAAISNPRKSVDDDINLMLKVWDRKTPSYLKFEFLMAAKRLRDAAAQEGWTREKQFLMVGEFPAKLHHMMALWFRTDDGRPNYEWRNDPLLLSAFLDAVKAFRVNTTSRPMTNPEQIEKDYENAAE